MTAQTIGERFATDPHITINDVSSCIDREKATQSGRDFPKDNKVT